LTILIDNCLPVSWIAYLQGHDQMAHHWRELGAPNAPDSEIMAWAHENSAVVLTQDLDFTRLLFQSRATLPSVIQLRLDDVRPASIGEDVVILLKQYEVELGRGALITVKGHKSGIPSWVPCLTVA
jgi:predicted nuclease of predicted toxin-antitoxin system